MICFRIGYCWRRRGLRRSIARLCQLGVLARLAHYHNLDLRHDELERFCCNSVFEEKAASNMA